MKSRKYNRESRNLVKVKISTNVTTGNNNQRHRKKQHRQHEREHIRSNWANTTRITKDKLEELREKLTKYSSIAQKYSQLKAAKQGRSTDGKEVHWKKLVPLEYWKYGDRFNKDRAKCLPKSTQ